MSPNTLLVPMDSRCMAAPNGRGDHMFSRSGGMIWTVPWVAGLYALACQVRPDVTPRLFWETARKTSIPCTLTVDGKSTPAGRILNPAALLDALR